MQAVVSSLLTNYTKEGSGTTLLLLHGWGDSSKGLESFRKELSRTYQVISLDLPGFGGSQAPPVAWGLDEYADFVEAFAAKMDLSIDAIVGHSNGGAIAIRALRRGLKAKKLILVASAGIRGEYKGRMKALRLVTKAGKALTSPLPMRIKKRLRGKVYSTIGSDMLVAEHMQATFKRVVEDDVRHDAAILSLPTLLIYGDADTSTPLRYGQILHEAIAKSKLVVIPNGQHWLPIDNTQQVADIIREFL